MSRPSLLKRLLWRMTAIMVTALLVLIAIVVLHFQSRLDQLNDRSLQNQAADIIQHLDLSDQTLTIRLPQHLRQTYARSGGQFLFSVLNTAGEVVVASDASKDALEPLKPGEARKPHFFRTSAGDDSIELYGYSRPVSVGGRDFVVQVGQGPEHNDVLFDSVFEELIVKLGWFTAGVPVLLLIVTFFTVKRTLEPLQRVSADAQEIRLGATQWRLSEQGVPLEVLPLVRSTNQTLERLKRSVETQRMFTADAAHELRTPLAILRANVDTLADSNEAVSLRRDILRMERITEQLLRLAQIDGYQSAPDERADLCQAVIEVAKITAPVALRHDRRIEVSGAERPMPVTGNQDLLQIVLRNLVENGLQHTPAGTSVRMVIENDATIKVIDHGPGVAPENRTKIFQRFWRAGKGDGRGAGLGLSIVERAVHLFGGDVTVDDAANGGAMFIVNLTPAAT